MGSELPRSARDKLRPHAFVAADDAPRLDVLVAAHLDISRNNAATLIANGHVLVNGRKERASYKARVGEEIVVNVPPPTARDIVGEDIPLKVVFEDEDLIVIDKAAGMVVHPAPGNWTGTLVNALKGRGGPLSEGTGEGREGIVHRLDKQTSGLLLVAKTDGAHRVLGEAMQARQITRRYAALAWGHLSAETVTVEKPLDRDPRDRTRVAVVATGRPAKTDFIRLARFESVDLLRAHLHSGRTHQIRVHLASIGHPVVGDDTYGGGGGRKLLSLPTQRHFLHAAWLVFKHPMTKLSMDFRSPLPEDLSRALALAAGPDAPPAGTDALSHYGFYQVDGSAGCRVGRLRRSVYPPTRRPAHLTLHLDPKLRFDNFIVGSGNRLAVAAARAVADSPGDVYNPLFVYAGSGLGKTHLMEAIGNEVAVSSPQTVIRAVTLDDILSELHAAVARGEADKLRQRYGTVGLLMIDDVQFLTGHAETQSELLRILNTLQSAGKQIVLTSDRPPAEIKDVDDRLITRMSGGLIVDINAPDYETRTAILHVKCEERKVQFKTGVIEELGRLEFRNIRELQGALNRLIAVQHLGGDPVRPNDVISILGSLAAGAIPQRKSGPAPKPVEEAPFEMSAPSWKTQLRRAIDNWSAEGFQTSSLERALESPTPLNVAGVLQQYEDKVARLRDLSRMCADADPALASNEIFFDPDRVDEAEQLLERTRLETAVIPGPSGTFTRAEYEVGPSNDLAVKAADAVIAAPGERYNPLFFHGPSGVGKTHLMHAIGNGLLQTLGAQARIAVIPAQDFVDELIAALQSRTVERWRAGFRGVDALLIDDVQFVAGKERTQEELFHVFNALHAVGKQIVFTSDRAPRDLQGLEDRLRSRFEGGLLVEVKAPDRTLRERLYAKFLRDNGWDDDAELVRELAADPVANVREIIGTVNRIIAAAELSGRGHTKSVAMQAARSSAGGTPRRPAPKTPEPAKEVLDLDPEKLILEWPDVGARLAEDPA